MMNILKNLPALKKDSHSILAIFAAIVTQMNMLMP